jgi:hypothetical protein
MHGRTDGQIRDRFRTGITLSKKVSGRFLMMLKNLPDTFFWVHFARGSNIRGRGANPLAMVQSSINVPAFGT